MDALISGVAELRHTGMIHAIETRVGIQYRDMTHDMAVFKAALLRGKKINIRESEAKRV